MLDSIYTPIFTNSADISKNINNNDLVKQKETDQNNNNILEKNQLVNNLENNNYQDLLDISNKIIPDNKECDCGNCDRCLSKKDKNELSAEEKEELRRLQERDREVRDHEQAHVNAGASNPSYEYETGPDGKRYAVGGSAEIEASKESTPEKTISKAEKIKRAALAPANPSSQDKKIAAKADQMKLEAEAEINKKKEEEKEKDENSNNVLNKNTLLKSFSTNNENEYKGKNIDMSI